MVNERHALKPDAYLKLLMNVSELNRKKSSFDIPQLIEKYGISWVLLSVTLEVKDHILPGEVLLAQTWDTWQKGFIFRKETGIYHRNGTLAISAASFHSLFDIKTRHLCKDSDIFKEISF